MVPNYNKIHNKFKLNGTHYSFIALKEIAYSFVKEGRLFEQEIGLFLLDWQDEKDFIEAKTSGSTGKPKIIKMSKQAMVHSAIATGDFFNLKPRYKALLCLPANYIAGKMMLIRAMVLGLELDCIEPKTNLQIDTNKDYHFSAMVPLQLKENREKLNKIKILIVGGASVSKALMTSIYNLKTTVFETYGMTETVSHIAVKQLNNFIGDNTERLYFKTLPNVSISQDERDCLVVNAPKVSRETIITNDIVKLHSETTFSWLGRFDHVINSGGIKVFPEQIENQLQGEIDSRFFIASEKDKTFGERVILIIEGAEGSVNTSIFTSLEPYTKPKTIYYINAFVETASGKIQRQKTLQRLKK